MADIPLDALRCPIDPTRTTELDREGPALVCRQCRVHFPVKLGIPVLLADEAELPETVRELKALPCRRSRSRRPTRG